jgi:pimeloyl-ACP methyl ester carboxylesterase
VVPAGRRRTAAPHIVPFGPRALDVTRGWGGYPAQGAGRGARTGQGDPPEGVSRTALTVVADDGVDLYVEVAGAAEAALTVVFCHGLAVSQGCWRFQRAAFADQARLVLYDQRGHGRSGRGAPGTATIAQLGQDLYRVLKEVAPSGPVVLIGHSMGGMAIMALAETHPELFGDRVTGVGLLASSAGGLGQVTLGLPGAGVLRPIVPGLLKLLGRKWAALDCGRRAAGDLLRLIVRRYSFASKVPSEVLDLTARLVNANLIEVIGDFYPTFADHHRFGALPTMRDIPVMILVGRDDVVTPVEHSAAIVRRLPTAELVVLPSTGHALMLERPHNVNSCLGRLLTAVQTGAVSQVARETSGSGRPSAASSSPPSAPPAPPDPGPGVDEASRSIPCAGSVPSQENVWIAASPVRVA